MSIVRSQERVLLKEVGTVRETLVPDTGRERVLLPIKKFSGPLGKIQRTFMHKHHVWLIWRGTRRLRFEVYDNHHLNAEASASCKRCPYRDCEQIFTGKGEWGLHAISSNHDVFREMSLLGSEEFRPICCSSVEMESPLREKTVELRRLNDELEQEFEELRTAYLQGQKAEGNELIDAVIAQLENDPEYAHQDPATHCIMFNCFLLYIAKPRVPYASYRSSH
jgi:hypothetical protein